jgi:hypothetical protein
VTDRSHDDSASQGLVTATWPKIVHINQIPDVISKRDLGKGESEVLSFALNSSSKVRAMLPGSCRPSMCKDFRYFDFGHWRFVDFG